MIAIGLEPILVSTRRHRIALQLSFILATPLLVLSKWRLSYP